MKTKKYKLILSKNQDQKLTDWTFIKRNDTVEYIPVKWKKSAAARFGAEGRETS